MNGCVLGAFWRSIVHVPQPILESFAFDNCGPDAREELGALQRELSAVRLKKVSP